VGVGLGLVLLGACSVASRGPGPGESQPGTVPRKPSSSEVSRGREIGERSLRVSRWAGQDADGDGLPDGAELTTHNDRENFRRWMTGIAEWQFYRMSDSWALEQRDCAGLIRFAWREALRRHDRLWLQSMAKGGREGPEIELLAPDVEAYTLDRSPLGEKLFRVEFGTFQPEDLALGRFSEFADARTLKNHNARFLGRDRLVARPADLLFFHQPWVQTYPYHVMLFLGEARYDGEGAGDWVVYHTGGALDGRGEGGEIRKLRLATLQQHPDPRWRPVESNRHFLGYYRLRLLD